eukprot:3557002-Prymnesium_polylepis.1
MGARQFPVASPSVFHTPHGRPWCEFPCAALSLVSAAQLYLACIQLLTNNLVYLEARCDSNILIAARCLSDCSTVLQHSSLGLSQCSTPRHGWRVRSAANLRASRIPPP